MSRAVHPHACGEYDCPNGNIFCPDGSSPRVWGIPNDSKYVIATQRFIPTRVGNTIPSPAVIPPPAGSSPRVWGILIAIAEISD